MKFKISTYNSLFPHFLLGLMLIVFIGLNISKSSEHRSHFVDGDGSGHYAWLSALFINHSLDFNDVFEAEKQRKSPDYQGHNYHKVNGTTINKFPPGTAFLIMPFYLFAMLLSNIFGLQLDGYNFLFQYGVGLAAVFWCWIGLLYLFKLLKSYKLNTQASLIFVATALFSTNLFAYTFLMPSFSHVYSFAAISALLYFVRKYFLDKKLSYLIFAAIALGLVFMIRPINIIIIIALPMLAENWLNFKDIVFQKLKSLRFLLAILLVIITTSPYLLINYLQTSHIFYFGYQGEGFYWSRPEILNFLFSFRKGWFIYTPFFILLFPAVFILFKKNRYQFIWFSIFFFSLIYVFSSWWNWFYGDSFGMRPMVDFTSIFVLVISLTFNYIKPAIKKLLLLFLLIVTTLNLVQSYQYVKGIIHPDSMNMTAYFKVFLKTSAKYKGLISGGPEYYYGKLSEYPFYSKHNNFEVIGNNNSNNLIKGISHSGDYSIKFNENNFYGGAYELIIPDSLRGRKNLYLKFSSYYYETQPNSAKKALYIMDIKNSEGKTMFYKRAALKQIPDDIINEWRKSETGVKIPKIINDYHSIKIYIWNVDKSDFMVDDFNLDFYEYKNKQYVKITTITL